MAIPQNKEELLEAIQRNFERVFDELTEVPPKLVDAKTLDGHGKATMMSVHDLASYLLGWNELVLKWLDNDRRSQRIDFPETGYRWNELGALAQKFYEDYADLSFAQVLGRLEAAEQEIVGSVQATSNEVLYGAPWYRTYTLGRMIQLNTASPYANARGRLRKWKRTNGIG